MTENITQHTETAATKSDASSDAELTALGVAAAANAISRGDITAESYAAALLRQARRNADLHSFITIDEDAVMSAARDADTARADGSMAPLLGVPLGVKDSYQTRALPTTIGVRALDSFMPAKNATVVGTIEDAGAIVFGKNNLVEMSYGVTGHNQAYGQAGNPYDRKRVSGGSSSGSASAVSARIVPASFGGDTVGSIRIPASLTGVIGFKPTTGRWPGDGVAPISHTLDTTGLLARSVDDVILIDQVVTGGRTPEPVPGSDLRGTRFAYAPKHYLTLVDPATAAQFDAAIERLRDAGAEVTDIDLGDDFSDLADRLTWKIFLRETREAISSFLAEHAFPVNFDTIYGGLKPRLKEAWAATVLPTGPAYVSQDAYNAALTVERQELQRRFAEVFTGQGFDALISPTTPAPAPLITEQWAFAVDGQTVDDLFLAKNTVPASGAGIPGITLPAGLTSAGLPVGIELDGGWGEDLKLLTLARRVETVLGTLPPPA